MLLGLRIFNTHTRVCIWKVLVLPFDIVRPRRTYKKIHPHSERMGTDSKSIYRCHLLNCTAQMTKQFYIITTRPPPSLKFAVCVKKGVGGVCGSFIHL